jgi:hypothetical protein
MALREDSRTAWHDVSSNATGCDTTAAPPQTQLEYITERLGLSTRNVTSMNGQLTGLLAGIFGPEEQPAIVNNEITTSDTRPGLQVDTPPAILSSLQRLRVSLTELEVQLDNLQNRLNGFEEQNL